MQRDRGSHAPILPGGGNGVKLPATRFASDRKPRTPD